MKQLLIIFLAFLILTVCGCSPKTENKVKQGDKISTVFKEQKDTDTSQSENLSEGEKTPLKERGENNTQQPSVDYEYKKPNTEYKKPNTEATVENNNSGPDFSVGNPETEGTSGKKPPDDTVTNPIAPPSYTEENQSKMATAEDVRKIAEKTLLLINEYRESEGVLSATVLPGLTKYAEYRSRQLIENFAHDTSDERAAATALKYGVYIKPELYGMTGEPYYTANAREAIGKGSFFGAPEQIANRIASGFRNSQGHWCYVGSAEYKYIAVGISYYNGYWYCDIAVSTQNTDN